VQVRLTDAGCAVSEFEVLDDGRVLGEVENLTPGLSGTFSLTLEPGTFETECPGGKTAAEGQLVVSGDRA
jgi:iron uptake system component EfeO